MNIKTKILENGLKIIYDENFSFPSLSFGVWVNSGAVYETQKNNGISHFIEHMLFKGSKNYSRNQISSIIEKLGGGIDAYSTKEYTSFYGKVVSKDFPEALRLISDMLINPNFDEVEFNNEKKVILEELNESMDNPIELLGDFFYEKTFFDSPLSLSILGTKESVNSITIDDIKKFHKKNYTPENTVITGSGKLTFDEFLEQIMKYFCKNKSKGKKNKAKIFTNFNSGFHKKIVKQKGYDQLYIAVGYPFFIKSEKERFSISIFNHLFGSGLNSRLFRRIREELALAYSISSSVTVFKEISIFSIFAIISKKNLKDFNIALKEEIKNALEGNIKEEEVTISKNYYKNGIILSLENSETRMKYLFSEDFYFSKIEEPETLIKKIENTKNEDILKIASKIFNNEFSYAILSSHKIDNKHLEVFHD